MSKVKITKKQAEFIEGFKKKYHSDNKETVEIAEELPMWAAQSLYNLMQFIFIRGLEDANGKNLSNDEADLEGDFQHDQVPLLIEAVMHGYEVKKNKKVILYTKFSDKRTLERRKLYYGIRINVTNRDSASRFDLNLKRDKEKVEKLKEQGWKAEEI